MLIGNWWFALKFKTLFNVLFIKFKVIRILLVTDDCLLITEMKNRLLTRNLLILTALMVVLFNYPLLGMFNKIKWVEKVPTAFFYLFGVWFVSVILLIIIIYHWKRWNCVMSDIEEERSFWVCSSFFYEWKSRVTL